MGELPKITDEKVLVGNSTSDDAAVYRISDTLAIVQTLDFFTPIVDDAYSYGAIAAANSLSDVYAMGGTPAFALNIVGFPRRNTDLPLSILKEVLRGGAEKAKEAGIDIVGGHSIDDNEPKYGLCVTGFVHPDRIWRNVGGRPGDKLILTKPIGTGIVTTALRAGKANADWVQQAVETMSMLNRAAAQAATAIDVHACTDITGFGLLGHLREMMSNGDVGATLNVSAIPVLTGARELAAQGLVPGGTKRNQEFVNVRVQYDSRVTALDQLLLCDPQTSGGLLFAVPPSQVSRLVSALESQSVTAAVIGELTDEAAGSIRVLP